MNVGKHVCTCLDWLEELVNLMSDFWKMGFVTLLTARLHWTIAASLLLWDCCCYGNTSDLLADIGDKGMSGLHGYVSCRVGTHHNCNCGVHGHRGLHRRERRSKIHPAIIQALPEKHTKSCSIQIKFSSCHWQIQSSLGNLFDTTTLVQVWLTNAIVLVSLNVAITWHKHFNVLLEMIIRTLAYNANTPHKREY